MLHISLISLDRSLYTSNVPINGSTNLVAIPDEIANSLPSHLSSLLDIRSILMCFKHESGLSTYISFTRQSDTTNYKIGIELPRQRQIPIRDVILSEFYCAMNATALDEPQSRASKSVSGPTNKLSRLSPVNSGPAPISPISSPPMRCHKCRATLSSLQHERGLDAYFCLLLDQMVSILLSVIYALNKHYYNVS